MTHANQWPTKIGPGAEHVGVSTLSPHWSMIAALLLEHKIPHTILSRENPKPPVLEGWSFSVYNGAEEHASGWGSTTLADMAPALLAAVGMTDASTAHKRAQAAETRVIGLAGERDAAVEALDVANDMIGKLCTMMAGAGFDGDLLSAVGDLIESRNNAIKSRDSKQRELIEVRDALGPSRTADSVTVLAKRMRASLNRWEAVTRELAAGNPPPTIAVSVEDLADRHFDLRLALTNEVDRLKSVVSQAERMRAVLDRWQDLAVKHLPASPQVSFTQAIPDLGSRHFALRGYMEGEINALRSRLSLAAEREDLTIAALGHPCSTNGIPEAVRLLRRDAERWLTECGEVGARAAAYSAENVRLSTQRDDARAEITAVRKALETPEGVSLAAHATEIVQREAKMREVYEARNHVTTELDAWRELGAALTGLDAHKATNDELRETVDTKVCGDSHEIARLRDSLNARATGDALALTKPLRVALGWAERRDLSAERVVEAAVVAVTHSVALSKEVTRLNVTLENTGGYGARERVKTLTRENEELRSDAAVVSAERDRLMHALRQQNTVAAVILAGTREALETPKDTNIVEHAAKVLRRAKAAEAAITNLRTEVAKWKLFALDADGHEALTADAKEALDHLIVNPGRGLTSELANEGAKRLRRHIEHGLPATQPLHSLLDLALSSGVNAAHEMWDAEVTRTRDEATTLRKRLDQWVAWGCRAACLNAAPDEALRSEIDKALPMWRRGAPQV